VITFGSPSAPWTVLFSSYSYFEQLQLLEDGQVIFNKLFVPFVSLPPLEPDEPSVAWRNLGFDYRLMLMLYLYVFF